MLAPVILSPGTIGFWHDWFFGPYPEMNERFGRNGLYIWDSQIGNKVYPSDWLFRVSLLPILSILGGEVLSKGFSLLLITLSAFSAYCLGRRLNLGIFGAFAVGLLYIFSPIIFTRIIAGHIYYLVGYMLIPLVLLFFLKGRDERSTRYYVIAGLILSFGIIQLQFFVLAAIVLAVFTLVNRGKMIRDLAGLGTVFLIASLISLSPIILSQTSTKVALPTFSASQLLSSHTIVTASNILDSFRLLGYDGVPYSYSNLGTERDFLQDINKGIIPPWVFYLDFLLPIVGFSALLFFRRDKVILSFAIIALIGLFLLKGLNPPFEGIFAYLFIHGFYLFRELWHVAFLYGFSIAFLVAFMVTRLRKLRTKSALFRYVIPCVLVGLIIVSNGYPLFLGNFAGYVQTYAFPDSYREMYQKYSLNSDYNILILPFYPPIKYDNLRLEGLDPLVFYSPNSIFPYVTTGGIVYPTSGLATWLMSTMQENRTDNFGSLLTGFGINYIIFRKDFESNFAKYSPLAVYPQFRDKWYKSLEPFLDAQIDLKVVSENNNFKVYENLNKASKIFLPEQSIYGLSDFSSLLLISNVSVLSKVSVYPTTSSIGPSSPSIADTVNELPLINGSEFIELGPYSKTFDARTGWTSNRIWFGYNYLLASRVEQGVFTNADGASISFKLPDKFNGKEIEIWLKALQWSRGGQVRSIIGNQESLPSLNVYPGQGFNVFNIFQGNYSNMGQDILLQNINGENYVEGLYVRELKRGEKASNNTSATPVTRWVDSIGSCNLIFKCNTRFGVDVDPSNSISNTGLQISTNNTNIDTWSGIRSTELSVTPRTQYLLVTQMKLNPWATASHIALEGFNNTDSNSTSVSERGSWYQMMQCPQARKGPLERHTYSCEVTIPKDTTKVRILLNAGWSSSKDGRMAVTDFDGISFVNQPNQVLKQNEVVITSPYVDIEIGNRTAEGKAAELALLNKFGELIHQPDDRNSTILSTAQLRGHAKLNPTMWNANVTAYKPFTLAFAEPFDPGWIAEVHKGGKKVNSFPSDSLFGTINSFHIKDTGELQVTIRYLPQERFEQGMIISIVTAISCIAYLVIDWWKHSKRTKIKIT